MKIKEEIPQAEYDTGYKFALAPRPLFSSKNNKIPCIYMFVFFIQCLVENVLCISIEMVTFLSLLWQYCASQRYKEKT